MHCPQCEHTESRVIDSRESPDGVRRRRECLLCHHRFTTYERIHAAPLVIAKSDGRREEFDAGKLFQSVRIACAKRPLETGALEKLTRDVENELYRLSKAEVESRILGEMVMERLRVLDRVAYIRFASVYRDFDDIDTFVKEAEALQAEETSPKEPSPQLTLLPDDVPHLPERRKRTKRGRMAPPK